MPEKSVRAGDLVLLQRGIVGRGGDLADGGAVVQGHLGAVAKGMGEAGRAEIELDPQRTSRNIPHGSILSVRFSNTAIFTQPQKFVKWRKVWWKMSCKVSRLQGCRVQKK